METLLKLQEEQEKLKYAYRRDDCVTNWDWILAMEEANAHQAKTNDYPTDWNWIFTREGAVNNPLKLKKEDLYTIPNRLTLTH